MIEDEKRAQVNGGLCNLIVRTWIDVRRVKGLYGSIAEVPPTDAAVLLQGSSAPEEARRKRGGG